VISNQGAGRRKTKLADLPPAARLALVSLQEDERIEIHLRYVVPPQHQQSVCIGKEEEWFGVPYQKWCEHLGKIIRLWEFHGDGPGMIGGPAKREVGWIWWIGAAEFPLSFSTEECLETASRLENWLADERYEFSDSNREDVLDIIYVLRMPREWQRANRYYISPKIIKRIDERNAEMDEAERREGESL
jgi:hypothetical protein